MAFYQINNNLSFIDRFLLHKMWQKSQRLRNPNSIVPVLCSSTCRPGLACAAFTFKSFLKNDSLCLHVPTNLSKTYFPINTFKFGVLQSETDWNIFYECQRESSLFVEVQPDLCSNLKMHCSILIYCRWTNILLTRCGGEGGRYGPCKLMLESAVFCSNGPKRLSFWNI